MSLEDVPKPVRVISQNGAVSLTQLGDDAYVKTSFARVQVARVSGAVEVENQNGAVDVELNRQDRCHPVKVRTSFAGIQVRMPENSSFTLMAKTSFAQIHSDFPMMVSGAMNADSVSGKIGAGVCPMNLIDQNGAIQIVNAGRK